MKVVVDIHSHFIPGIDDGVQSKDESLHLITQLNHLGYKKLITTPHIYQGVYNNTPEIILAGLEKMRDAVRSAGLHIQLEAASEYFFDVKFIENVKSSNLLTFGDKYVLFELASMAKPPQLEEIVFELNTLGYKPVLAHPERYIYFHKPDLEDYHKLHDMGLQFQLNALSLTAFYSVPIRKYARLLIQNELVDWIGSDMHNQRYLDEFKIAIEDNYYMDLINSGKILNNQLL